MGITHHCKAYILHSCLVMDSGMIAGFSERMTDRWMGDFLAHDPGVAQRQVKQPVLAVYGAIDRLTSPALNAGPLMSNLAEAPVTDIQLVVLPVQDHFFLRSEHLAPGEHKFGEMHIAPELTHLLANWLQRNQR